MPGKPMPVGPFTGGLNTTSDSGESRDDEVVQLVNFEVGLDTSLTSRPPFKLESASVVSSPNKWRVLCIFRISSTEWYLIANKPTSTGWQTGAYLNGDITSTPTYVITTDTGVSNEVLSATQYGDTVYFVKGIDAPTNSFKWNPNIGLVGSSTMPKGSVIIAWKERLWVAGTGRAADGNRVRYSTINETGPQPDTWATLDYFDVAAGEGGFITTIVSSFNNLIVFKNDGTWKFSYPSKVSNGTVDKVSGAIGAAGPTCVVEFENLLYVYDQGRVYELINGNFSQINRNIKFERDPGSVDEVAPGADLSVLNRRIILRYENSVYAYTVDTRAWSQWRSANGTPGRFWEMPGNSFNSTSSRFIAQTSGVLQSNSPNFINQEYDYDYIKNTVPYDVELSLGSIAISINETSASLFYIHLNNALGGNLGSGVLAEVFNIPVATGQLLELKLTTSGTSPVDFVVQYYKDDGTTTVSLFPVGAGLNTTTTVPSNCILAKVYLRVTPTVVEQLTLSNISIRRVSVDSPKSLISVVDEYPDVATTQELIFCEMKTKSYDYKQPSLFKRLFWWGVDIKTYRPVETVLSPIGKRQKITWGDLTKYTGIELSYGTWGNPLSWLGEQKSVTDVSQSPVEVSENGRYFVKLLKSIRFRQVSYYVKTSTLGNKATGPAKLFSLTTVVDPKATVVEKSS